MRGKVEFRLLSEQTDWLTETLDTIYRDLSRFGRLAVLSPDEDYLNRISEALWFNAKEHFVTYGFANEETDHQLSILLCSEIRFIKNRPALVNLNYLLDEKDLSFRHVSEIVFADPEMVDKARRQYKMYRISGYQIDHIKL